MSGSTYESLREDDFKREELQVEAEERNFQEHLEVRCGCLPSRGFGDVVYRPPEKPKKRRDRELAKSASETKIDVFGST